MKNEAFKVVLLQALPASGKSEVRNFMANIDAEKLLKDFHIGENLPALQALELRGVDSSLDH